jgi:uncharacterized damage-inducible protein DinB
MGDQKPPRVDGEEAETLLTLLRFQRDSFVRKLEGLDDDAARQEFVGSGTTLLWLVKHLARGELLWVVNRFAGDHTPLPDDAVQLTDTLADAIAFYRKTWKRVDKIVAISSLEESCHPDDDEPVNLRWILAHLLEETARHAGHADILRELVDGQTGR